MNGSDPKLSARELLEEAHPALVGLSHWIHANPEIGFQETLASGWVAEWLVTGGFEVETGIAGLPTAVIGRTGPGPLHVAICVEYDALPEVGHACGHNIIAAASVGAGLALASVAEELGLRITVLGTPAEETGGGKLSLIEAGAFDGVHAALMVHPWPMDIATPSIIAVNQLEVTYTGREAHAAGFPQRGRNAADALVIAQTAIGLLRQQLLPTDRVHGIVTRGGDAPNIIPAHTTALYMVRAHDRARMDDLTELVTRCFEAGALATGTTVTVVPGTAYSNMVHDADLAALYRHNAEQLGRVFDDAAGTPLSTDMGNVSHIVPSIHPMIGIEADGAVNHQAAFADACATPSADQAILDAAVAMSWTVIDAAQDEVLRGRLIAEGLAREALALAVEAEVLEEQAAVLADAAEAIAAVDPDAAEELVLAAIVLDEEAQELTDAAVERLDEAGAIQDEALLDEVSGELASDAEDLAAEGLELADASDELAEEAVADLQAAEALEAEAAELEEQAEAVADVDPDTAALLAATAVALDEQARDLKDEAEIDAADAADLAGTAEFVIAAAADLADEAEILSQVEPESLIPADDVERTDEVDGLADDAAEPSEAAAESSDGAEGLGAAAFVSAEASFELADEAGELAVQADDLSVEAEGLAADAFAFEAAAVDEAVQAVELGASAEELEDEAATLAIGAWAFESAAESALDDVAEDATVALDAAEEAAGLEAVADALAEESMELSDASAELSAEADVLTEEALAVASDDPDGAELLAASAFEFETRAEEVEAEAEATFEQALEVAAEADAAEDLAEVATEAAEDAADEAIEDAVIAEVLAEEALETEDLAEVVTEAAEDAADEAIEDAVIAEVLAEEALETEDLAEVVTEAAEDAADEAIEDTVEEAAPSTPTLAKSHSDWDQQFQVVAAHAAWEDEYARMLGESLADPAPSDTATAEAAPADEPGVVEADEADEAVGEWAAPSDSDAEPEPEPETEPETATDPSTETAATGTASTDDAWYSGAPEATEQPDQAAEPAAAPEDATDDSSETPLGDFEWIPAAPAAER